MLGVRRDASPEDIRAAYRTTIRSAHPDAGGSQDRAARLNAAYTILSDPARRADWDRRNPVSPASPTRPAPPPRSGAAPRPSAPPPPPQRSSPGPAVVFVGVVALALVGILLATLGPADDDPEGDSPFIVAVGDCVDLDPGVPTDVPCDGGRADGEVVALGPTCPADTELVPGDDGGVCIDRFPSFSPESCVDIAGQVVTPVECGPAPDGIISAVVDDPNTCPLGATGVANLGDGRFACIVIP